MKRQFLQFVLLLAGLTASIAQAADPPEKALGDLTGPWQLFVDDYLVAEKTDVVRSYATGSSATHSHSKFPTTP